ncbi:LysM peptidoglycan-binding domain-containing protein [Candidatus Nitrosacidococcus tergens]|uniref:LysM peptidoglycan-binding domain-containing protein n=1 Tax=Candidatus Nitrosacidococcus tergens TaxID=553981 RepID=UPI0018D8C19D|nr:LysM peptidoglycan-binding domain-containing protein [Candidatus Nitrosacidococcus tergens]
MAGKTSKLFPLPLELEQDFQFWIRVYTEIDTYHGFVHDSDHINVIYNTVALPQNGNENIVKDQIEHYKQILLKIAQGKRKKLSAEEKKVLALWPKNITHKELRAAADRIRFQRGQADRFKEGLIRSGAYKSFIYKTLKASGLPQELAVLPHVESSFNPGAYSKVGASGLWQFTRATGQRFLQVNHIIDERRDPFQSTIAAAQLLQYNYEMLKSWPLAITAYNHGISGMVQAKKQLNTSDIATIRQQYKSPIFGFASKNFYLSFLAALEVDKNAIHYFGALKLDKPNSDEVVELTHFVPIHSLVQVFKTDEIALKKVNPALLDPVWHGVKYVPQGYKLHIPCSPTCRREKIIAFLAPWQEFDQQIPDKFYQVQQGQTLSEIAKKHGVAIDTLAQVNNLSHPYKIRVGQKLRLPLPELSSTKMLAKTEVKESYILNTNKVPTLTEYTVQQGDTLSTIAQRFGIQAHKITNFNKISDPRNLQIGQNLQLPIAESDYTIQQGDTLSTIAQKFKIKPHILAAFNRISDPRKIQIGQHLRLPAHMVITNYTVQSGDTLSTIAEQFGMNSQKLARLNGISDPRKIRSGQQLKLLGAITKDYIVQQGDTLSTIAQRFGITLQALLDSNGINDKHQIYIGQRLQLAQSPVDQVEN